MRALRMNYIVNSLAQYEVHVARYYYSRGAYVAAINRAQQARGRLPAVPALEEALYIMVRSLRRAGHDAAARRRRRVLEKNYPDSEYLTDGLPARPSGPWWKFW